VKGNLIMISKSIAAVCFLIFSALIPVQNGQASIGTDLHDLTPRHQSPAMVTDQISGIDHVQLKCLADNMYFEARSEGAVGMLAVAMVTINRVTNENYPDTICEVVHQGKHTESWKTRKIKDLPDELREYVPVTNRCQFSWYCDGVPDIVRNKKLYEQAMYIAEVVLSGFQQNFKIVDITEGATHYHAVYVDPRWANTGELDKVAKIGSHIFYRKSAV
jgi:spore germination cell wall hydrolase CwlJ-like protein